MNHAAIWGTGLLGNIAYHYYKDRCNIFCYIDSDKRKWGNFLNGIKICSPDVLKSGDMKIILAMKRGTNEVRRQLEVDYGIGDCILFQIDEKVYCKDQKNDKLPEDTCIVLFSGGLGNQMFQYAFFRNLQQSQKNVMACLKQDIGTSAFCLLDVFKKIKISVCTEEEKIGLAKQNTRDETRTKKFLLYTEASQNEVESKIADISILNVSGGIFSGFYQSSIFPERVNGLLKQEFIFEVNREYKLKELVNYITSYNSVGIHIRRGDYLAGNNNWIYGDICTREYYMKAMAYIENKIGNCKYIFFSNDMEWVRENYKIGNAFYINEKMFENYQDWYDMYLMSICKHNIIANSTFSWWSAWLNSNKNKIVIAPQKWVNLCEYRDIYPDGWVKI